ncbi:hypothetical protein B0H11DRAFT_2051044 [Mycena galericulata]|nr:hypothetical protein B0H11DRAFT_2051044 [Mycena galericulata]
MDSPLHDKIGTNYAPLDSEIAQIKDLLLAPSAEIERLDHEIAKLHHKRWTLRTFVDGHRALIAPIRRLPPDIVREIFVACMPVDQNAAMSAHEAPLLLGRICSAWRTVALSTPTIWSSIHIVEPLVDPSEEIYEGCLQLVRTWLERSGAVPLSISFRGCGNPLLDPSPYFETVVSFSHRWQHISLWGCSGISLSKAQVPMLQSIKILDYALGDERSIAETQEFLGAASVQDVVIGTDINPMELPLPWSQLTTLVLTRLRGPKRHLRRAILSSSTALNILSECRNLRKCALTIFPSGGDETVTVPSSVELPLLSSLTISMGRLDSLPRDDPLDHLVLPHLSEFVFSSYRFSENEMAFPLLTLISTALRLQKVDVETLFFTGNSLATFLRQLSPSVRSLHLRQSIVGNAHDVVNQDILRLLTPQDHGWLLPNLETIELNHATGFSDDELLHFIRARLESNSEHRLRHVTAKFFRYMLKDIVSELKPLMDEFNLEVSLHYWKEKERWNPREGLQDLFIPYE